jgi:hypothetical protein
MNSWCTHPPEELQRVFSGARPLPGRRLCGLCGEIRFDPGEPALADAKPGARAEAPLA